MFTLERATEVFRIVEKMLIINQKFLAKDDYRTPEFQNLTSHMYAKKWLKKHHGEHFETWIKETRESLREEIKRDDEEEVRKAREKEERRLAKIERKRLEREAKRAAAREQQHK